MHRVIGIILLLVLAGGCSRMRTTDPPRTATEQYLHSVAAEQAAQRVPIEALAGREVFIDAGFVTTKDGPTPEQRFMVAEFRARLLQSRVRLVNDRAKAKIIVELLSGGLGVDRYDFLLGIPTAPLIWVAGGVVPSNGVPNIAAISDLRQYGFADLGFVAYWQETGEVIADADPALGRSHVEKFRFIGTRARTRSNIPTAEPDADE